MNRTLSIVIALSLSATMTGRGDNYFVDGYHGGIYGHYPLEWKTGFIVDEMHRHPSWRLGLEIEPETWDSVRSRTPEAYEAFRALMKEGRMEYTNPTYAQPYCYNILGESLIRQFSYGIRKLHSHFPGMTFTTYSSEEPCFTSCLPAILKGFGFRYASLKCPNTCWGGYVAPYGGQLVNWEGPDGTVILTVPRYACENLEPRSVWQTTAWGNSPAYLEACRKAGIKNPAGMCYQDAGWRKGPWLGADGHGSEYVLWSDYISLHTPGATADTHRFTQDDIRVNLMWGSQVLQRIARQVRRAENAMLMAEKIGAIAWGINPGVTPDSAKIDEAWRQLMLAQHHDSWIVPYNRLWNFGTWADAIEKWTSYAETVARGEILRTAKAVNPGDKLMVKVFNTTALDREEVVEVELPTGFPSEGRGVCVTDHLGREIHSCVIEHKKNSKTNKKGKDQGIKDCFKIQKLQFKATVPPMGYATYNIARISENKNDVDLGFVPDTPGGGENVRIENDRIMLEINLRNGGTVKSLKLKGKEGYEYAPADTSRFSLCELRGFFYEEGRFRSSTETPARIIAYEQTPLAQSVTVAGEIGGHPFLQTYRLAKGSARVDCSLHIDWQGNPGIGEYRETNWKSDRRGFCDDRYKLCLLLPASFKGERLLKDAPFDSYETTYSSNVFNRWSGIKNNIILNWIDVTDREGRAGLGLMTDHTGSYVHDPAYPPALTLQYSGPGLWGMDYGIKGPLDVDFSIIPHGAGHGADVMADEADRFNEPLQAILCGGSGNAETKSLLGVDGKGYKVSAAIVNPDGKSMTLRMLNTHADEPCSIGININDALVAETDLRGNVTATPSSKSKHGVVSMEVRMPRNGFTTYSISRK